MSSYPTDDSLSRGTPIFDETVTSTAVHVDAPEGHQDQAGSASAAAADTAKQAAGQVKDQAQQVGAAAGGAAQQVASTTKDQASKVASDAVGQARELYGQATDQLSEQAAKQQKSAAATIRTFGDDLAGMQHDGSGLAAELVQGVSTRAGRVSDWLEAHEPAEVLDEVKQFAARRPGLFIGLAVLTGVVAARATKALVAEAKPDPAQSPATPTGSDTVEVPTPGAAYGTAGSGTSAYGTSAYGTSAYGTSSDAPLGDVR